MPSHRSKKKKKKPREWKSFPNITEGVVGKLPAKKTRWVKRAVTPTTVVGLDEARDIMREAVEQYLKEFDPDCPTVLVLRALPGIGKTRLMEVLLSEYPELKMLFLGPYREHNIALAKSTGGVSVLGKNDDSELANCKRMGGIGASRRKQLPEGVLMCGKCPEQDDCDYWLQFQDKDRSWFMATDYAFTVMVTDEWSNDPDLFVIDEEFISKALLDVEVWFNEVERYLLFAETHEAFDNLRSIFSKADDIIALVRALRDSMGSTEGLTEGVALLETIETHLGETIDALLARVRDARFDVVYKEWLKTLRIREAPRNFVPHLVSILQSEVERRSRGEEWNTRILTNVFTTKDDAGNPVTYRLLRMPEVQECLIPDDKPLVVMDSSIDPGLCLLKQILPGRKFEFWDVELEQPVPVVQVMSNTFSKSSLRGGDDRLLKQVMDTLAEAVEKSGSSKGPVGMITHKSFRDNIEKRFNLVRAKDETEDQFAKRTRKRGFITGHFWGIRGSRRFEDCSILFVVGFPQPRREDLLAVTRAYFHRDSKPVSSDWEKVWLPVEGITNNDGEQLEVEVEVPKDPRMRLVWEMQTRQEVLQAVYRLRLLTLLDKSGYESKKLAVLLCQCPIDRLRVTGVYNKEELKSLIRNPRGAGRPAVSEIPARFKGHKTYMNGRKMILRWLRAGKPVPKRKLPKMLGVSRMVQAFYDQAPRPKKVISVEDGFALDLEDDPQELLDEAVGIVTHFFLRFFIG